jgi:hypothetical protein
MLQHAQSRAKLQYHLSYFVITIPSFRVASFCTFPYGHTAQSLSCSDLDLRLGLLFRRHQAACISLLLREVVTVKPLPTSFRSLPIPCADCFVNVPSVPSLHGISSLHIPVFFSRSLHSDTLSFLGLPFYSICQTYRPTFFPCFPSGRVNSLATFFVATAIQLPDLN